MGRLFRRKNFLQKALKLISVLSGLLIPRHGIKTWLCLLIFAAKLSAATIVGEVTDQSGRPLADAVIVATPTLGLPAKPAIAAASVALDQHNREFIPHVLVIPAGTEVNFPNHDHTRHHVYSFSPAKRFEIKLYKNMPPNPIRFDMPGIAVLGCNIHDWMLGYVYVTDSPYFTKTDSAGHWSLELPAAAYTFSFWHPALAQTELQVSQPMTLSAQQTGSMRQALTIKSQVRSGKPPASLQDEGYNGEP
jgi:plastocyanin